MVAKVGEKILNFTALFYLETFHACEELCGALKYNFNFAKIGAGFGLSLTRTFFIKQTVRDEQEIHGKISVINLEFSLWLGMSSELTVGLFCSRQY